MAPSEATVRRGLGLVCARARHQHESEYLCSDSVVQTCSSNRVAFA